MSTCYGWELVLVDSGCCHVDTHTTVVTRVCSKSRQKGTGLLPPRSPSPQLGVSGALCKITKPNTTAEKGVLCIDCLTVLEWSVLKCVEQVR